MNTDNKRIARQQVSAFVYYTAEGPRPLQSVLEQTNLIPITSHVPGLFSLTSYPGSGPSGSKHFSILKFNSSNDCWVDGSDLQKEASFYHKGAAAPLRVNVHAKRIFSICSIIMVSKVTTI